LDDPQSSAHHLHSTHRNILRDVLKYSKGRLSIRRSQIEKEDIYVAENSSTNNSNGGRLLKLSSNLAVVASRRLRLKKRMRGDQHVVAHENAQRQMCTDRAGEHY
jgi:hypothetical protein